MPAAAPAPWELDLADEPAALPAAAAPWAADAADTPLLQTETPGVMSLPTQLLTQGNPYDWDLSRQIGSGLGLGFGPELQGMQNYLYSGARQRLGLPADQLSLQQQIYNARQAKGQFETDYPGWAQAAEIGGSLPTLAIANELTGPAALMRSPSALARFAGAAGSGAEAGALQTGITGGDPAENALTGATVGLLAPAAGKLAKSVLLPKVDPEVIKIARDLEAQGVNLRPTQIAMSRAWRRADQLLASGGDEKQLRDFTRSFSHTFGADTDALTDDAFDTAERNLRTRADAIVANTSAQQTNQFNQDLALIASRAKGMSESDQKQIRQVIKEIRSSFDRQGLLSGKAYQNLTQRGGPVANLASGSASVKEIGGQLKEKLDDLIEDSSPPGTREDWSEVRQQFKNLNIGKAIASRNPAGLIDPASLVGKINQLPEGDLRPLAKGAPLMPRPEATGGAKPQVRLPWLWKVGPGTAAALGEGYLMLHDLKSAGILAAGLAAAKTGESVAGAALQSAPYRNWLLETRPPWTAGGALPNALTGAVNELRNQKESDKDRR